MGGSLQGRLNNREMLSIDTLPAEPGSYALHLALRAPVCLLIGRLGEFTFPAGDYLYLGSALGPGGLRGRLRHHVRASNKPHWHLDWLHPHAVLVGGWYATGRSDLECTWSKALASLRGAVLPAPGFGATDCRNGCPAHLIGYLPVFDVANVESRLSACENVLHPFRVTHSESRSKVE